MALRAKVLMVGPPQAGKTAISNIIAEATESSGGSYHPTKGVRILEFESDGEVKGEIVRVEVELWDCSGNRQFENIWPVFAKDTKGVVIIYDPADSKQEKEIEKWYKYFVRHQKLKDSQCIIFANHKPNDELTQEWQAPIALQNIRCIHTNLDSDSDTIKEEFSTFLMDLVGIIQDKQEKEETGIVGGAK